MITKPRSTNILISDTLPQGSLSCCNAAKPGTWCAGIVSADCRKPHTGSLVLSSVRSKSDDETRRDIA